MINITPNAAQKVLESLARADSKDLSLRVAAKRLADGSFDYAMGLDTPTRHDTQAVTNGVNVVVAPTSIEFLKDATLDYVELEAGEHQFIFMNPNDPAYVPSDV